MKRGAALPMVLLTLGMVAALVVGGLYVSRRSVADAGVARRALELESAAEQALADVIETWSQAPVALPVGSTSGARESRTNAAITRVWVTRLDSVRFWVVAESETAAKPLLYRRLSVVLEADSSGLTPISGRPWAELP